MDISFMEALNSGEIMANINVDVVEQYYDCIADIIDLPEVVKLDQYSQHLNTSRYQHSVNVSYYSFLVAKALHCDARSSARGGLLHDLFFYNWKDSTLSCRKHALWHPYIALENACKITTLNNIEQDIILKHMWPLTVALPKYKESFIVSFADKYCATFEVANSLRLGTLRKLSPRSL